MARRTETAGPDEVSFIDLAAVRDAAGFWPGMQSPADGLAAAVTGALGPAAFAAAVAAGARLRVPDALRYGLAATAGEAESDPFPDWAARLRPAAPGAPG